MKKRNKNSRNLQRVSKLESVVFLIENKSVWLSKEGILTVEDENGK